MMTESTPKTRVFFEEGVSMRVLSMDTPDEIYVVDGRLSQQKPSEVSRPIIKIEFHGRDAAVSLYKQEAYEGELTIKVGFLEGEEEYKLYIYDDEGDLLADPLSPAQVLDNDGLFPASFPGYFIFETEDFPDPNMGIGP
jgi:hypothetical protein